MLHSKNFTVQTSIKQHLTIGLIALLSAMAWLVLWLWGQSPYTRYLQHQSLELILGKPSLFLLFVLGWLLMMIAMMLPTTLPLVALFQKLIRQRLQQGQLLGLLLLGYLSIWTVFGVVIYVADGVVHLLVAQLSWLNVNSWTLAALTLVLAGIYQFTSLKYQCLEKCRSPLSFITEYWSGKAEYRQAFLLGFHHGLFCIACCWSLMLVMFALGMGNLGWMLLLAIIMTAEKNFSWGKRLSMPLGIGLIAWGWWIVWLARPIG